MLQEANTFSPVMTRYEDFTPVFGQAALERHRGKMTEMGGFIEILTKARKQIAPVCAAWAITANRLLRADFERLVNEFPLPSDSRRKTGRPLAGYARSADGRRRRRR